ncbi:XrtA/PEP-CTERM system-associated ATPase [Parasphingorhabdus sp.]|uniref:XrtA/PEP-CTERM system-associated ATPase n=1 Tax=Parasphingorhabdus sp. TaxID=2709688 RepID=UPI003265C0F3
MYETFYGLTSRPFQLTPDPHYYFESVTHRKALSYLGYGLAQGEGFIVITGDVGAGKTTLVSHLMATIDKERLTAANIVTTKIDSRDIVRIAANNFDIDTDDMDKAQLLSAFEEFLHSEARAGRRCLLIVDESQNLQTSALEELRMLSNFQLGGQALLQIFLLGQPEFRDKLQNSDRLEQLRQRVIAHHHLDPMGSEEIEPYITHRLSKSGWSGRPKITSDVFRILYSETGGVPRKINTLMSRVLLMGSVEQAELIDQALVGRVLADLSGEEVEISQPQMGGEPSDIVAQSPLREKPVKATMPEMPPLASVPKADAEPAPVPVEKPILAEKPLMEEKEVVPLKSVVNEEVQPAPELTETPVPEPKPQALDLENASETREQEVQMKQLAGRLAELESRMDGQEENLHRVLTMLVDWVESDIRSKESYVNTGRAA